MDPEITKKVYLNDCVLRPIYKFEIRRMYSVALLLSKKKLVTGGSLHGPDWNYCINSLNSIAGCAHIPLHALFSNWKERAGFGKLELANRKKRSVVQFSHGIRAAPTSLYSTKVVERCTVSP